MNNSKVYKTPRANVGGVDIDVLRKMLPDDFCNAKKVIYSLEQAIELEEEQVEEVVTVELSTGTYVKAVEFLNDTEVKFLFNEGTEKVFDQTKGLYQIGEKIYYMKSSCIKSLELNTYAQDTACNSLISYAGNYHKVWNAEWIDLLYKKFPKARSSAPDDLYNGFDVNGMCTRIEHFRSYVTTALGYVMGTIPDNPNITLATVLFSRDSVRRIEDIIRNRNGARKYPIKVVHIANETYDSSDYVYYLMDIWTNPAQFDHGIVAQPFRRVDFDGSFKEALGKQNIERVTPNSSVIIGSFNPILDTYFDDDGCYCAEGNLYKYAQFAYVPHKPWSIVNVALRGDKNLVLLDDSSDVAMDERHITRVFEMLKMVFINIQRNFNLAKESIRATKMNSTYKVLKDINNFLSEEKHWYQFYAMKQPVLLKSKRMDYEPVSPNLAVDTIILIDKLDEGVLYGRNEMISIGWDDETLNRALSVGLLDIWKDKGQYTYRKYTRTNKSYTNYFRAIKPDRGQVSVILPDGAVASNNSTKSDLQVECYPQVDYPNYNEKNYKDKVPYDEGDYLNSDKMYAKSTHYLFTRSPSESNEGYLGSGVIYGKNSSRSKGRRGDSISGYKKKTKPRKEKGSSWKNNVGKGKEWKARRKKTKNWRDSSKNRVVEKRGKIDGSYLEFENWLAEGQPFNDDDSPSDSVLEVTDRDEVRENPPETNEVQHHVFGEEDILFTLDALYADIDDDVFDKHNARYDEPIVWPSLPPWGEKVIIPTLEE